MNSFFYIIIFLFGLIVGSFLNSVIYRLEQGQSFLKGRSFCPYCKHQLFWLDLIPIFSFLILKGKCRYCRKLISWQYPSVELTTGFLFLLGCNKYTGVDLLHFLVLACFLIIIFVYDLKHYIIPDKVIYPAIAIVFLFRILNLGFVSDFGFRISDFLISAFGAAAFFFLIVLTSRGKWMGIGDIKLAFLMGLVLGWPNIVVALFSAVFLGAIIGIGLIMSGRKTLKSEVPFGPFLVFGTFLALFWGESLINFYFNLFS